MGTPRVAGESPWDANAARLAEVLIRNGYSVRIVMEVLRSRSGNAFTESAIIGKAHRMKWSEDVKFTKRSEETPTSVEIERMLEFFKKGELLHGRLAKPRPPEPEPLPEPEIPFLSEHIQRWMCRWPKRPGRDGLGVCGKTTQPGRHLCAEHLTEQYRQRHPVSRTDSCEDQEQLKSAEA